MMEWHALYQQHGAMRAGSRNLLSSLRMRLIKLAERGHCDGTIRGRFRYRHEGPVQELYIEATAPERGEQARRNQGERLRGLRHLEDAYLTVIALVSRRKEHVHQFTAMIEGTTTAGSPWVAAIHLEGDHEPPDHDRKGGGACGHAAFHCHVGPTMDDEPKVRVPFPAVGPAGALDWLLSVVIPDWESAPWPRALDLSR